MGATQATINPLAAIYTQQAENQQLPSTLAAISAQEPTIAANQLAATQQTQPAYNALNLQQLQQYALPEAQIGQQVQQSNALAGGNTNLLQILGSGGLAAGAATGLNNLLNPVQATNQSQAQNLLNSINLNGLSGGEQSAVERSLNQSNYATGNLGLDNATNAVSNAMNYGNYLTQKRAQLGSALGVGTGVASAQNQQVSPINIALGQPLASTAGNFGTSQFGNSNSGTQAGAASNAFGGAQGLFSNISGLTGQQLGANQSSYNNTANNMTSLANTGANLACCFIVLESYHGTMPSFVRKARDHYYSAFPQMADGYRTIAKLFVPLMRRSSIFRSIIWHFMVSPATNYFGATRRDNLYHKTKFNRVITRLWLRTFNIIGRYK